MATTTTFKGVVYLTEEEYSDLVTNGSISKGGETLTYNASTLYVTDSSASTVNDAVLTIQKNGTTIDTFSANASQNKTINITVPTSAADISALPSSTKYGSSISLSINSSTYVVTAQLKDQDGNNLGSAQTIDLPLESVVVNGSYDSTNKKVVLTLQSGSTIEFSVADLVAGLQSEITSSNKLDADLVDDSTSTNKFTTTSEKNTWNGKQNALPTTSTAGKVLKSTSTSGTVEWGDQSSTDVKVDNASITSGGVADLKTINGNYNASSNKLATASDLPASITITTTSGSEAVSDGTNTLRFGANAFNSTSIPTTYVSSVNGNTGAVTGIATTSDIPTSVNGMSGGQLTSPLIIKGGDAATASKIALDASSSGQITNASTQTIFGFTSNNAANLTVGHSSYGLALRGSGTRPKFNGNNLALSSDVPPTITITTTSGSQSVSDGTNTLNFGSNAFNSTTIPTSVDGLSGGTISSATNVKGDFKVLNSSGTQAAKIDQNGDVSARYVQGTWLYTSAASDNSGWTDVFVNSSGWLYKRSKAGIKSDLGIDDKQEKLTLLYDASDSSSSINWGKTSGIANNVTVTGKDFSPYKFLLVVGGNNANIGSCIVDLNRIRYGSSYTAGTLINTWYENGLVVGSMFVTVNSAKTSITPQFGQLWTSNYQTTKGVVWEIWGIK